MPRSNIGHRKDSNHSEIAQHCKQIGMYVWDGAQVGASVDLFVVHQGVTAWVEIKDPDKASKAKLENPVMLLTEAEFEIANGVMDKGGCYIIAFEVEDIIKGVEEWLNTQHTNFGTSNVS